MRADLFFLNDEPTHTSASSSMAFPFNSNSSPSHYNISTNNDK
jgi:hypothetical protein